MSSTNRSTVLPAALIAVSVIALLEAVVIVYLLAARNNGPVEIQVPQSGSPTVVAQVTQDVAGTSTPARSDPGQQATQPSVDTDLPRGAVGETVESGGFALTVRGVYDEPDPELQIILDVGEEEQYIATEVVLENRSNDSFFYASSQFKLKDSADFEYVETLDYREPAFGLGTMVPGERVRGYLSFIVPRDASGLSLIFQPGAGADYQTIYIDLGQ